MYFLNLKRNISSRLYIIHEELIPVKVIHVCIKTSRPDCNDAIILMADISDAP